MKCEEDSLCSLRKSVLEKLIFYLSIILGIWKGQMVANMDEVECRASVRFDSLPPGHILWRFIKSKKVSNSMTDPYFSKSTNAAVDVALLVHEGQPIPSKK